MSKEKPEVGDVWKHNEDGFIFRITYIENELYKWAEVIWENGHISRIYYGGLFSCRYTYVGKAKANINDLFEVEE